MCLDRVCWFLAFQSHPHAEPLADWLRLPLSSSQPSCRFSSRIATLMKKLGHWNVLTPFACHGGSCFTAWCSLCGSVSIERGTTERTSRSKARPSMAGEWCQHVPMSKFPVPSQAFTERFGATRILVGGHCRLHGREHVVHTGSSVFCSQLCFCTHVQPLGALASMDCVGWSSIFCRCQHAVHDESNAAVRSLIYGHDLPRVKHCVQQLVLLLFSRRWKEHGGGNFWVTLDASWSMMGPLCILVSGEETACPSNELDDDLQRILSIEEGRELEGSKSDDEPVLTWFVHAIPLDQFSLSFSSWSCWSPQDAEDSQDRERSHGEEEQFEESDDANCWNQYLLGW